MVSNIILILLISCVYNFVETVRATPNYATVAEAACETSCTPIILCPEIFEILPNITEVSTADEIPDEYLCPNSTDSEVSVCCPFSVEDEHKDEDVDVKIPLQYKSECCPQVLFAYGGHPTYSGEFPFLALFHYVDSRGRSSFSCAGTLINKRYIVTAAHCVTGTILKKSGELKNIRLGEHDWSKTRCENGQCSNGVKEVNYEKIIIHEGYSERHKQNDIALIRLKDTVEFFPYHIAPICLRWLYDLDSKEARNFTVVGWGRTLLVKQSAISNKLHIPPYDHEECRQKYGRLKWNITDGQICAGGEFKKDTCDGDSGGPLITSYDGCDYLDGIVSFGKGCGLENWPGVYTNVTAYKDWIVANVELERIETFNFKGL